MGVQVPLFAPQEITEEIGEEPPPDGAPSYLPGSKGGATPNRAALFVKLAAAMMAAVAAGGLSAARIAH